MAPDPRGDDGLFGALFGAAPGGDLAWLTALLEAERALATAGERAGLIPPAAAAAIASACAPDRYDVAELGRQASLPGNPVVPLVAALEAQVPPSARPYVHLGATSQDIMDTALALLARRRLEALLEDLRAVADGCAELARAHRSTIMAARTLLQQAGPTTFGLRAAGWLVAVDGAAVRARAARAGLGVQLGGAVGTLAALGDAGLAVRRHLAEELGLAEAVIPWHTNRLPVAELAACLGIVAGVLGKIALDVELLAQTELAEVAEGGEGGAGGSSTLPHKRNPVRAVLITAVARRTPGLVATLLAAMPQEHERGAGGWHAEWEPVTELLRLVGAAAAHARVLLAGLRVDPSRMRAGVDLSGGLIMAESVAVRLTPELGRGPAHELVERCCREARARRLPLRSVLLEEPAVRSHLSMEGIDRALQPEAYLGSSGLLIDGALAAHEQAWRLAGQSG